MEKPATCVDGMDRRGRPLKASSVFTEEETRLTREDGAQEEVGGV